MSPYSFSWSVAGFVQRRFVRQTAWNSVCARSGLSRYDEEDVAASLGRLLGAKDEEAGRDRGRVEEVRREADDRFEPIGADETFADHALGRAAKEDAVRHDDPDPPGDRLHRGDHVLDSGVVAKARRRDAT